MNHSDDFVGMKTAKPIPATAFSSDVTEERCGGVYTFMGDEDESEHAKAVRELFGMKIYAKDGQLFVKQSARSWHSLNASRIADRPECFSCLSAGHCFESGDGRRITGLHISFPDMGQGSFRFVRRETNDQS